MEETDMENAHRFIMPKAYYALRLDTFSMEIHQHERFEIMYVVKGSCVVEVEGEPIHLSSNQFIFLNEQVPHRLCIQNKENNIVLNYEFGFVKDEKATDFTSLIKVYPSLARLLERSFRYYYCQDIGKMEYALKDLIAELEHGRKDAYLLDILFQRMLIELSRCMELRNSVTGIAYVKRAVEYIRGHYDENLKVTDIAGKVGINKSYLQILFKKTLGSGIMAYVNQYRMERASFLLRNSNMSIIDIAFEVGYNSRQHFGYTFEKHFHISPGEYRKMNGQSIQANTGEGQKQVECGDIYNVSDDGYI